jgi:hypothetical protein
MKFWGRPRSTFLPDEHVHIVPSSTHLVPRDRARPAQIPHGTPPRLASPHHRSAHHFFPRRFTASPPASRRRRSFRPVPIDGLKKWADILELCGATTPHNPVQNLTHFPRAIENNHPRTASTHNPIQWSGSIEDNHRPTHQFTASEKVVRLGGRNRNRHLAYDDVPGLGLFVSGNPCGS